MTLPADPPAPLRGAAEAPPAVRRAAAGALRAAGVLVTFLLAVCSGMLELVLAPLRLGGVPVGLAVVLAVAANYLLPRFAVAATDARWPALAAFAGWLLLMLVAVGRTAEGDVLVAGAMGVAVNVAGSVAFGVAMYRELVATPGRPGVASPPAAGEAAAGASSAGGGGGVVAEERA